jgi:arylamine N-acetyltransferase
MNDARELASIKAMMLVIGDPGLEQAVALAAARATADLRHTLRDCSYTCRDARGVVVAQQQVTTAVQAVRLLHEVFGIDVPQGDAVLARLDAVLNPAS